MSRTDILKQYLKNQALPEEEQDFEDKAMEFGGKVLEKADPVLRVLDYPAGLLRGAVGGVAEAVTGRDDLVDIKDVLKGKAPSSGELLEKMGVPEGKSLSDILPGMYSESGKGAALQKGGMFDPTTRGAAGFAADIVLDPLSYLGAGAAKKALKSEEPFLDILNRKAGILRNERGSFGENLPKLNQRGFYYKLDKVLSDKMGPVESPERVMNLLSEIKPEEIKHSKVLDFIQKAKNEGKKINKQEILDYIEDNRINIERLENTEYSNTLVDKQSELIERQNDKIEDLKENLEAVINQELNAGRYELPEKEGIFNEPGDQYDAEGLAHFLYYWAGGNRGIPAPDLLKDLPKPIEEAWIKLGKAKLEKEETKALMDLYAKRSPKWQGTNVTPGSYGDYRESLIQYLRPFSDPDNPAGHFNEFLHKGHFDDPDIIAHSRTASYRDADSNLYHHSSENQADLHQQGTSGLYDSEKEELTRMYADFQDSPEFRASMEKIQQEKNSLMNSEPMQKYREFRKSIKELWDKNDQLYNEIDDMEKLLLDSIEFTPPKMSRDEIKNLTDLIEEAKNQKKEINRTIALKEESFDRLNPEVKKIERKIKFLEEDLRDRAGLSSEDIKYLDSSPDAPLKASWQEHLIKQDLIDAARKDAEYYSWSTGRQQALQNAAQDVKVTYSYDPKKGTVTVKRQMPKQGPDFRVKDFDKPENMESFEYPPEFTKEEIIENINHPQELLQNVYTGKLDRNVPLRELPPGVIKKLLKTKPDENGIINVTKTTASSLGARHHYDVMTPSMIKNLLKKFNPKIELYVKPGGGFSDEINRVRLTPEMKQHILKYGFPVYMLPFLMGTQGEEPSEKPEFKQIKSKLKG